MTAVLPASHKQSSVELNVVIYIVHYFCNNMFVLSILLFILEAQFIPNKQLQPKETQIYIKLVKYAMQALDIYQV